MNIEDGRAITISFMGGGGNLKVVMGDDLLMRGLTVVVGKVVKQKVFVILKIGRLMTCDDDVRWNKSNYD